MFKKTLIAVGLIFSFLVTNVEAQNNLLPKAERQKLILERAMKEAEARRARIEQRRQPVRIQYYVPVPYYYYQRCYNIYPHYHYNYQYPYYQQPTFYFWYRF